MRLILGLDSPDSGTVTLRGRPHRHSPAPMHHVSALPEARAVRGGPPDGQLAYVIARIARGIVTSDVARAARACTGWPLVNQLTIH